MARSLEGKWFHICYNNGVYAVVSHEIYENIRRKRQILVRLEMERDLIPHIPETPIFTFAGKDRVAKSPWFTGNDGDSDDRKNDWHRLMNYIHREGGHYIDATFYVPFSNGCETGLHGPATQCDELRYVTTDAQFKETFGISLAELRDSDEKYL